MFLLQSKQQLNLAYSASRMALITKVDRLEGLYINCVSSVPHARIPSLQSTAGYEHE